MKLVSVAFGIVLFVATGCLRAEQVIKDGFNQVSESKVPLASAVTETGSRAWEATPNVVVLKGNDGGAIGLTDNKSFGMRLPVSTEGELITVEAQVHPNSESASDPWIAVGLGNTSIHPKNINITWSQGLFLLLTASGRYQCLYNPTNTTSGVVQLLGGTAPNYRADGMNRLKIEYHRVENRVTMWVNGQKVLSGVGLEKKNFTPTVSYAGVTGYGQNSNVQSVDDFQLTIQP